ncbi:MAG: hypothetical protein ACOH1T_00320 [Microbacteriaceae bacterium]
MGIFSRSTDDGRGSFNNYRYDLLPKNKRVTITLSNSDPCHDEIARIAASGNDRVDTFIAKRTIEEERTDAPLAVRLFVDSRMSQPVGFVPRGLEAVVLETLGRIEQRGRNVRIPARLTQKGGAWRVELMMGETL